MLFVLFFLFNCCFNSRAHRGRDKRTKSVCSIIACFNSRAHRGRDGQRIATVLVFFVSIHAPTGGATQSGATSYYLLAVSIHAPTGGATNRVGVLIGDTVFQFTRPQGARPSFSFVILANEGFNSRAHRGRDTIEKKKEDKKHKFQFTRPQGARRNRFHLSRFGRSFNSRAHRGRDIPVDDDLPF